MARQVLENGVILPAEYSDDWYDDMTSNLTKLDDVIGSDSEKLSSADVGAAALSNNYNDLDNLPTIPTVNDATLTIQKNGVDVQTFTANASSNVTANITVPTKTSDITNDSNFVDTSNAAVASGITSAKVTDYDTHIADTDIHVTTADKTSWNTVTSKANDSDVVHKSGNETKSGELTLSDTLNSSDIVPIANNSYSSGSSNNQWNNLYAKNYYYNGVAWGLDKSNTWSAANKFSVNISPSDITDIDSNTMAFTGLRSVIFFNTTGSSNRQSYSTFLYSGYTAGTAPDNYGQLQLLRSTDKRGDTNNGLIPDTSFKMWRVAPHYLLMDFMDAVRVTNNGDENSLKPITNNTTDLGTSTNKWKTFNGLNPSSLSLPSGNASDIIDISSYLSNLDGTDNTYVAPANGWISISVIGTAIDIVSSSWSDSRLRASSGNVRMLYPVLKNETLGISVIGTTLAYARFIPCQGNV